MEGKGESRKPEESKGCVERKANSVGGIGMCLTSQGDWRYTVNHLSSFNRTERFHHNGIVIGREQSPPAGPRKKGEITGCWGSAQEDR